MILIVVDTLRAKNVPLYGYARNTTPSLAAFARDAITYERAISPGTWTVPAHGSLFTGMLPSFHGAERAGPGGLVTPLHPNVRPIAELLKDRGWATGGFVANTTFLTPSLGFHRGFQSVAEMNMPAGPVVSRSVEWLAQQPSPAFLFLNILDPHEPYAPEAACDPGFPGRDEELGTSLTKMTWAGEELTTDIRAHFRSQYDGEIACADQALGAFFTRLRALGRYDETLIIVTSDHGELLGEHGEAGHGGAPYEELVHVPLLVKRPGNVRGGERVTTRVSTLGVFAEILDHADVTQPAGVDRVSLDQPHPVWVEDRHPTGERVVVGYHGESKLVYALLPDDRVWARLYDLERDPTESRPSRPSDNHPLMTAVRRMRDEPRPTNPLEAPPVNPERRRKLRALGYVP